MMRCSRLSFPVRVRVKGAMAPAPRDEGQRARRRRALSIAVGVVVLGIVAALLGSRLRSTGPKNKVVETAVSPSVIASGQLKDDPVYGLLTSAAVVASTVPGAGEEQQLVTQETGTYAAPVTLMPLDILSGNVTVPPSWAALSPTGAMGARDKQGAASSVCYPTTGRELEDMASSSTTCPIIVLANSRDEPYITRRIINVTSAKVIVGNPFTLPIIRPFVPSVASADLTGSDPLRSFAALWGPERVFDVLRGGVLDLRHITVYTGYGRLDPDARLLLLTGGTIRVQLGGRLTATGCVLGEEPQTVQQFLGEVALAAFGVRIRVIGGFLLVAGGTLTLTACIVLDVRYFGDPLTNEVIAGGAVLQLGGNTVLVGTYFLNCLLFASFGGVGGFVAVLGGTMTWIGGGLVVVGGAINVWGAGKLIFIGGGVLVEIGANYATAIALYHRSGLAEKFVGGGVHFSLGLQAAASFGCVALWMTGNLFGIGGGTATYVGPALTLGTHQFAFAGVGGTFFVGSGHLDVFGASISTSSVASSLSGLGLFVYNGAGNVNLLQSATAGAAVATAQLGYGLLIFNGAGWVNAISTADTNANVVTFQTTGSNVAVGSGGGAFVDRRFAVVSVADGNLEPLVLYNVGPLKVPIFLVFNNILVTDDTIKVLSTDHEATAAAASADGGAVPEPVSLATSSVVVINDDSRRYVLQRPEDLVAFASHPTTDNLPPATESPAGAAIVRIDSDAACFLCDIKPPPTSAHVSGNNTCEMADGCEGGTTAERVASAQDKTSMALPPLQVNGASLLWRTVRLFCDSNAVHGGVSCSSAQAKQSLRRVLRQHFGERDRGYSLQVDDDNASLEPHLGRQTLEMPPIEPLEPPDDLPQCGDAGRFQVYLTTMDETRARQLNGTWAGLVDGGGPDVRSAVLQAELVPDLPSLCAVEVQQVADITYPTQPPAFRPSWLEVGPTITVVRPGEASPAREVVVGHTYDVYVGNFAKGASVRLHAIGTAGRLRGCDGTLPDLVMGEGGRARLGWRPSEACGLEVGRRYYLTAFLRDLPAVFASSMAFKAGG